MRIVVYKVGTNLLHVAWDAVHGRPSEIRKAWVDAQLTDRYGKTRQTVDLLQCGCTSDRCLSTEILRGVIQELGERIYAKAQRPQRPVTMN